MRRKRPKTFWEWVRAHFTKEFWRDPTPRERWKSCRWTTDAKMKAVREGKL